MIEIVADSAVGVEDLVEVEIQAGAKCLVLPVATAEKSVKYHSNQQAENLFTAVSVLKKWVVDVIQDAKKEQILDLKVEVMIKAKSNLKLLMLNSIKS